MKQRLKGVGVLLISFLVVIFSVGLFLYTLKPEIGGILRLEQESPESVQQIVEICKKSFNWRDCYGKQLAMVNYRLSLTQTLKFLEEIKGLDGRTRDCHLIAHRIATSEVEKNPSSWIDIFNFVDQTTCNNGFVHGVLEGRSKFDSDLVLDEKTIPQICSQIEERTSARVGKMREGADDACGHIMGHILLAQENGVMKEAVNVCTKLQAGVRRNCFDGIFMENITRENLEAHEVAQRFELTREASIGLEENCKQYEGEAGLSCWRELAHIYTPVTDNNPKEVYSLCYQSENKDYAFECFMHSINLMVLSDGYSDQNLADTCREYWSIKEKTERCVSRTIMPLIGSSVDFVDRAVIFCKAQPKAYQQFCYTKIGQEIAPRVKDNDTRLELCKKVPNEFLNSCLLRD